jgi:hypothetical protein
MSAWIVSRAHIDVLVNGLIQYDLIKPGQASAVGRDLWQIEA